MKLGKRSGSATIIAAALVAAAAGCSTEAPGSGTAAATPGSTAPASAAPGAEVKTDTGVEGDTIKLGVLTDLTGVFAALGADITNANQLYWEKANAAGGVCNKYKVELDIQDTGYVPQTGVTLYSGMKDNVLAMQQTIGSPINTALRDAYEGDTITNLPSAWARNLTEYEGNGVVGATYDIETTNVLNYALSKNLIKDGDKIGHIYFEGEYGANGLAGSKYMATKHKFQVLEQKIKPTDTDMTAAVTAFKAGGVKAILLTTAPGQTASVAGVAAQLKLDVPILGNNPVFAPGLLKGPAAATLKKSLIIASPFASFDKHPELLKDYTAKFPNVTPSLGVVFGTGMSEVMKQILDKACANGDLTRQGVLDAKKSLTDVDTGDLITPLNFSKPNESPSAQNFILQPADVPGGVKLLQDEAFEGEDVKDFAAE